MKRAFLYKKYSLITFVWVLFSTQIFCQSYTDALIYFDAGKLTEAKQQIDEYIINNETNVNALILKSKIYYAISATKQYSETIADGKSIAVEALKTAGNYNSAMVYSILKAENFALPLNLHKDITNEGIVYFNSAAERKDKELFAQALGKFKKALSFSAYIHQKNWGLPVLDSNNWYYAAKSAIYAGKEEEALLYAKKIADNQILETQTCKDFQPVYEWLVYYYRAAKNEALLQRYTDLGTLNFPKSAYFTLNYIDWLREANNYSQLVATYKLLFSKGFNHRKYKQAYFTDVFFIIYSNSMQDSSINREFYKKLFEKEITTYISTNSTDFKTILLAGKYYRNTGVELQLENKKANKQKIISAIHKSNSFLKRIVENRLAKKEQDLYTEALMLLKLNKGK